MILIGAGHAKRPALLVQRDPRLAPEILAAFVAGGITGRDEDIQISGFLHVRGGGFMPAQDEFLAVLSGRVFC